MSNPFKDILQHQEVPDVLRQKVLNDVGMIKLTLDITDLFVVKYPNTVVDLISGGGKKLNKK